jgi:2-methylisocitrate lyase-like PEP mutase family enzyme
LLLARTDALAVHGIDEAIDRANRYLDAGADWIFVEAPETVEHMQRIIAEIDAPMLANMIPGGKTPLLSAAQLQEIGFAAVAFPTVCTYAIAKAVGDLFSELRVKGTIADLSSPMLDFDSFNDLVGLPRIREKEAYYYRNCRVSDDRSGRS